MRPAYGDPSKDRIRGTVDLPLSPTGKREMADLASKIALRGGLDVLFTSPLYRGRQLAKAIARYSPGVEIHVLPGLMPWPQGQYEGMPSEKVRPQILAYIEKHPDLSTPGIGPLSGKPGSSFNLWKSAFLGRGALFIMRLYLSDQDLRIGAITHTRDIETWDGWIDAGTPKDFKIDMKPTKSVSPEPTAIERIWNDGSRWKHEPENMNTALPFDGGIYTIRHPATPFNAESYADQNTRQN